MRTSFRNHTNRRRLLMNGRLLSLCVMLAVCGGLAHAQSRSEPAKAAVTGNYDGTAKNNAGDVIPVTLELTEKEGAISGMIRSSHGDFSITHGSHQGEAVTLEFDAGGPTGAISLKITEDNLVGTWSAGDDGGPIDLMKVAAQEDSKGKS